MGGCGAGRRNRTVAVRRRRAGVLQQIEQREVAGASIPRPDTRWSRRARRPFRRARRSRSRPSAWCGRRRPADRTRRASRTRRRRATRGPRGRHGAALLAGHSHRPRLLAAAFGLDAEQHAARAAISGLNSAMLGVEERVADAFGEVAPERAARVAAGRLFGEVGHAVAVGIAAGRRRRRRRCVRPKKLSQASRGRRRQVDVADLASRVAAGLADGQRSPVRGRRAARGAARHRIRDGARPVPVGPVESGSATARRRSRVQRAGRRRRRRRVTVCAAECRR